ncbi:hypothetical protein R3P38DRAFT_3592481 [Favolaschia claudopus]|uniref:BTB domain-containing protein n=1 Tax=Favolaschia claudopus TaxID=2862362 RepID=A0AAW0AGX9_9AGAR
MATSPAPAPIRSTKYYDDTLGYPVFLVENTLYKLDPHAIFCYSPVLQDIASIPGPGLVQQQSSDTNPIPLSHHGKAEFEMFVRVAYGDIPVADDYGRAATGLPLIVKSLELSQFLMAPLFRKHCLTMIQQRTWAIPGAKLIFLSYHYRTRLFFETAFHHLASSPLRDLTVEDVDLIGFRAYVALARLKEAHAEHRSILAAEEPVFDHDQRQHSMGCLDHEACEEDWHRVWWNGMGRCLLDGRKPLTYTSSREYLESMHFGRMSPGCRMIMLQSIKDDEGNSHIYEMTKTVATFLMTEIVEDLD